MIEADAIERVFQGNDPLNLVGHDHRLQHLTHAQRCLAPGQTLLRQMIGDRENTAQIVGRMPPLGRQPGVVVVQPADQATDVPGGLDRIEAKAGARHAGAVGHHAARHQRPQVLDAFGKAQRQQRAAEAVHQAVACGVQGLWRLDAVIQDVFGDVLQHRVVSGTFVQVDVGRHGAGPPAESVEAPRASHSPPGVPGRKPLAPGRLCYRLSTGCRIRTRRRAPAPNLPSGCARCGS